MTCQLNILLKMSHKAYSALGRRAQLARINAALQRANEIEVEPAVVHDDVNRQLPVNHQHNDANVDRQSPPAEDLMM